MAKSTGKVTIKKYANRRLYDTESSTYITLDRLAQMVREGREFEVVDAKTGEDITRQVLTQIIVDEEARGSTMLRSEERRVGKEWRSRWWPEHQKKQKKAQVTLRTSIAGLSLR